MSDDGESTEKKAFLLATIELFTIGPFMAAWEGLKGLVRGKCAEPPAPDPTQPGPDEDQEGKP